MYFSCASPHMASRSCLFSHRADGRPGPSSGFPRQLENSSPSQRSLVVEHRCPNSQGSSAPPLTTCSTIRPNSNHLHAIPYPLHPPTQPPCRAPSRSRAARAMLPHRESALAYTYNQHPTPGPTLPICLPRWRVSSATTPTTTTTHNLDLNLPSILASYSTREHTHNSHYYGYAPHTDAC